MSEQRQHFKMCETAGTLRSVGHWAVSHASALLYGKPERSVA